MKKKKRDLLFCFIVFEAGLVIFLVSYFPMKAQTDYISDKNKDAVFELETDCIYSNKTKLSSKCYVKPMFNKLVFLVIDALRPDILEPSKNDENIFRNSLKNTMKESMPYFLEIINSKNSLVYKSIVRPPTVTLSGIKVRKLYYNILIFSMFKLN